MTESSSGNAPSPRHLKEMLQRAAGTRQAVRQDPGTRGYAFVAYARHDAAVAAAVVEALEARGIAVSWDRNLKGGDNFRKRLSQLIEAASAVIVLWSHHSVASDFVIDEAEEGKARGKLITCRLQDLGDGDIPFGFRQLHCVDVADTQAILEALAGLGVAPPQPD